MDFNSTRAHIFMCDRKRKFGVASESPVLVPNSRQIYRDLYGIPKAGVDYSHIEALPHLRGGIIVEQEPAIEIMEGLVAEMDRR